LNFQDRFSEQYSNISGFGGLGVACWPRPSDF